MTGVGGHSQSKGHNGHGDRKHGPCIRCQSLLEGIVEDLHVVGSRRKVGNKMETRVGSAGGRGDGRGKRVSTVELSMSFVQVRKQARPGGI